MFAFGKLLITAIETDPI